MLFFEPIHVFLVDFLLGLSRELSDSFLKVHNLFEKSLQFIILLGHLLLESLSSSCFIVQLTGSKSFDTSKFIVVLSLPLVFIINKLITISFLPIVLIDLEVLVSLLVSIFLELSLLASLRQLPLDSVESCLSLLIR